MQTRKNLFAALTPNGRRGVITIGLTTLGFIAISPAIIMDLRAATDIQSVLIDTILLALSIIGAIATWFAWNEKTRTAGYLMIASILVVMLSIPILTTTTAYSTIAAVMAIVLPVIIAINTLPEREFAGVVVVALIARAAIQLINTIQPPTAAPVDVSAASIASIAQWVSIIVIVAFVFYTGWNLRHYSFRVKMILILGLLTIIPITILDWINRRNLENTLTEKANQSLVLSADQLASAVDFFLERSLDNVRTEAQIPAFEDFLSQPNVKQGLLFTENELKIRASDTLTALARREPINVIAYSLLDKNGLIQASTDTNLIGTWAVKQDYYYEAYISGMPFVSTVLTSADGSESQMHFSAPIRSASGIRVGVLDVTYSAAVFQQVISGNSDKLGTDVSAVLLDEDQIILAHSSAPELITKIVNQFDPGQLNVLTAINRLPRLPNELLSVPMEGLDEGLLNISTQPYFSGEFDVEKLQTPSSDISIEQAGAAKLKSADWYVVTFVPQATLLAPVQQQTRTTLFVSILISLLGIGAALGATQILISPILSLTKTSERITQGEVDAIAEISTSDEIGALALGFNSMTERLRGLISSLESRVAERTKALERRAIQLQAAADVGSTIARLRDTNQLLNQIVRLISQRFGFYHVGIFLLDENNEYAVLRATNSEGGQRMLAREHKLKVGQIGIVGYVTNTGQARIALDVGEDAEFFNNPDLVLTHSEMALPLIAGGKIIGALDIQSTQEAAFSEEDITTLKVLADQIAIAIENARLFSENQIALEAARRAYGEISIADWQRLLREKKAEVGYVSLSEGHVSTVSQNASPEALQAMQTGQNILANNGATLHLPIKIRGQSIGAIRMDKPEDAGQWTTDNINMASELAEQLGTALESARLYDAISQRAVRESVISDITSKIGASIQIDTILRTSVEELGRALQDSEVIIQLGNSPSRGE